MTSARPTPFTAGQGRGRGGGSATAGSKPSSDKNPLGIAGRQAGSSDGSTLNRGIRCRQQRQPTHRYSGAAAQPLRTCTEHHGLPQGLAQPDGSSHDAPQCAPRGHDIAAVEAVSQHAAERGGQCLQGGQERQAGASRWEKSWCQLVALPSSVVLAGRCRIAHLYQCAAQGEGAQLRQAGVERLSNEQVDLKRRG